MNSKTTVIFHERHACQLLNADVRHKGEVGKRAVRLYAQDRLIKAAIPMTSPRLRSARGEVRVSPTLLHHRFRSEDGAPVEEVTSLAAVELVVCCNRSTLCAPTTALGNVTFTSAMGQLWHIRFHLPDFAVTRPTSLSCSTRPPQFAETHEK